MITLNVLKLLEKHGKTKYWLYKQMGMSYQNFNRMKPSPFGMKISKPCASCLIARPTIYSR